MKRVRTPHLGAELPRVSRADVERALRENVELGLIEEFERPDGTRSYRATELGKRVAASEVALGTPGAEGES